MKLNEVSLANLCQKTLRLPFWVNLNFVEKFRAQGLNKFLKYFEPSKFTLLELHDFPIFFFYFAVLMVNDFFQMQKDHFVIKILQVIFNLRPLQSLEFFLKAFCHMSKNLITLL